MNVYTLQCLKKPHLDNFSNIKSQILFFYATLKTLIKLHNYFDPPNSILFMCLLIAVLHGMLDMADFAF